MLTRSEVKQMRSLLLVLQSLANKRDGVRRYSKSSLKQACDKLKESHSDVYRAKYESEKSSLEVLAHTNVVLLVQEALA